MPPMKPNGLSMVLTSVLRAGILHQNASGRGLRFISTGAHESFRAGGWANQDRRIQCPRSEPMALEVGSRLGHYDVTALIGEGGMGQVYQATDTKLNRQVAWTWGRPDTMRSL